MGFRLDGESDGDHIQEVLYNAKYMAYAVLMRIAVLSLLLLLGAACGRYEITPLAAAARAGDAASIQALCKGGVSLEQPSGVNGWTPLMHAVHKRQARSVMALLRCGAQPDTGDGHNATALMMAAGYGYDELVGILLRHGADPHRRDVHRQNAFDYARHGVMDLDRFTAGRQQTAALKVLEAAGK